MSHMPPRARLGVSSFLHKALLGKGGWEGGGGVLVGEGPGDAEVVVDGEAEEMNCGR